MFVFLPAIAFLIVFTIIHQNYTNWRDSIPSTSIIWGILIALTTELLSIFQLISFGGFLGAWLLIDIGLIFIYFRLKSKPNNNWQFNFNSRIEPTTFFLVCGICFVVASVGLIAIIAPPNNWDSMDYHLSRVVHWIQNHNIAHYPTSYTPQLYQNPWSEFVILHFQILGSGDYFANLIQWLSMIGSIIIVSLIAKQLGAELKGQVFAAVVATTIPMGILQASNTQNDYVLAFWLVCLAYYTLSAAQSIKKISWTNYFYVGSSIGLAILTKGTAYFYVFPFVIWLCIVYIKHIGWQAWKPTLIIGCISLSLNICHYLRNYNLFASPFGEPGVYKNEILGINVLISNILRNLALHLGTPVGLWNGKLNKLIQIIHNRFLGLNIVDPRITFTKSFFVPGGWTTIGIPGNENSAGNLFHTLLIGLTIAVFIYKKNLRKERYILAYLITVLSTFLVFCYLVKWQAWNSRLHLPFFVLISPFLGLVLSRIKQQKIAIALVIFLLSSSLTWAFFNRYRPIIGNNNIFQISRTEQYFANRPYLKNTYIEAVKVLKTNQCSNVGLLMGNDPWEYPFWVLGQQIKFQHINVNNDSAKKLTEYPYKDFEPCGIIAMQTQKSKLETRPDIVFKNKPYIKVWDSLDVGVFLKK